MFYFSSLQMFNVIILRLKREDDLREYGMNEDVVGRLLDSDEPSVRFKALPKQG